MSECRSRHAPVLCALVSLLALVVSACTPPIKKSLQPAVPLTLSKPTRVSSGPVSLEVGNNRWPTPGTSVEEAFLPLAVTVRNTGDQPLCGGVSTAVLSDTSGASVSALFPEGVVTRLFGSFAALEPLSQPTRQTAALENQEVTLLFVHGSAGGYGGGLSHGMSGFPGSSPGLPHLGPSPRPFTLPPSSPLFRAPLSPFSPGYPSRPSGGLGYGSGGFHGTMPRPPHLGPSPWGVVPPPFVTPFASPFTPFAPSPFLPWYRPFPPWSPYGSLPYDYHYAPSLPYAYPPALPPNLEPREEAPPKVDQALVKEILTVAFASRPLAPHEERSGFLFFPFPVPDAGTTMLTWGWYGCGTQELVAHLTIPVVVEKKI